MSARLAPCARERHPKDLEVIMRLVPDEDVFSTMRPSHVLGKAASVSKRMSIFGLDIIDEQDANSPSLAHCAQSKATRIHRPTAGLRRAVLVYACFICARRCQTTLCLSSRSTGHCRLLGFILKAHRGTVSPPRTFDYALDMTNGHRRNWDGASPESHTGEVKDCRRPESLSIPTSYRNRGMLPNRE